MKWIRWAFNQKSTSGEWEREKQIYLLLLFEEEEYKKFMAYLYNPKNKVSLDNILDIFSQIIDGYSEERPMNGW